MRVCGSGGKVSVEMEDALYHLLSAEEPVLRLRMLQSDDVW